MSSSGGAVGLGDEQLYFMSILYDSIEGLEGRRRASKKNNFHVLLTLNGRV